MATENKIVAKPNILLISESHQVNNGIRLLRPTTEGTIEVRERTLSGIEANLMGKDLMAVATQAATRTVPVMTSGGRRSQKRHQKVTGAGW